MSDEVVFLLSEEQMLITTAKHTWHSMLKSVTELSAYRTCNIYTINDTFFHKKKKTVYITLPLKEVHTETNM